MWRESRWKKGLKKGRHEKKNTSSSFSSSSLLPSFILRPQKKTLRPAQLPSATFPRVPTMAAAFVTSGESSPFSVESRSRGRRRERTGGACPDALSPSCRFNHSSSSPLSCSKPMPLQPEPLRRCARTSTRRDPLRLRRRAARRARPQLRARFLCRRRNPCPLCLRAARARRQFAPLSPSRRLPPKSRAARRSSRSGSTVSGGRRVELVPLSVVWSALRAFQSKRRGHSPSTVRRFRPLRPSISLVALTFTPLSLSVSVSVSLFLSL